MDLALVEDQILDSDFTLFENFFKAKGSKLLLIFQQDAVSDEGKGTSSKTRYN